MKKIVKDCLSLQYGRSMWKNDAIHLRSYIPISKYWPEIAHIYYILAAFKLSSHTSYMQSLAFTSAFIILP